LIDRNTFRRWPVWRASDLFLCHVAFFSMWRFFSVPVLTGLFLVRSGTMLVMRPAQMADLAEVQRLAADSPIGVTSLPDDAGRLGDKIAASEASFAAEVSFNGEETYFFVLEDSESGRLVGCSGIVASAGYSEPFYSFRNETFVHASRELKIHNKIHVLSQCHDLTGNSLLTSFYVVPELVGSAWSELNSRGRLLFVASHPERFADSVVTEIVGYSDENGDSPFWDAIGRNFFDLNYAAAERLCGLKSRTFLAELMPHYPIYVPLLPDAAQEAMGQVHPRAQITFDILMREGFETDHYIDIFDGGPTLHARVSGIRSIAQSRLVPVKVDAEKTADTGSGGRLYLVANGLLQDYRAILLELDWAPGKPVALSLAAAEALGVGEGASVRVVAV
jgi:arginine N-succinyltransferase